MRTSSWNCAENQWPASGEFARAPVMLLPLRPLPVYVGSHIRSKPLPSSLSMGALLPSDSPGGLAQTYASIPASGAAVGRSPMPAPLWLHQLPAWIRRSTRPPLT